MKTRHLLLLWLTSVGVTQAAEAACSGVENPPYYSGQQGVIFSEYELASSFVDPRLLTPHFVNLADALKTKGMTLVVALVPTRGMVNHEYLDPNSARQASYEAEKAQRAYKAFVAALSSQGVLTADLLTPILEHDWETGETPYQTQGVHWLPTAARVAAETLADTIKATGATYDELPKVAYETEERRTVQISLNDMVEAIQKLCGQSIELEHVPLFVTEEASSSESENLFGDAYTPVTVVGTSFSGASWHFPGFLQQALELPVLPLFVTAGQMLTSVQEFLLNEAYKETRAETKFLVWELPIIYLGVQKERQRAGVEAAALTNFRQLIPEVYGACSAADSLVEQTTDIRGRKATIVSGEPTPLESASFLFFRASDPTLVDFEIELAYGDGSAEQIEIERSTRVQNSGAFYLTLADGATALSAVTLTVPKTVTGTVEAKLCPLR